MYYKGCIFESVSKSPQTLVVMLSGPPCTGKTSWRELMVTQLQSMNVDVTVLNSDELAYQLRDEINHNAKSETPLTYSDMFTPEYTKIRNQRFDTLVSRAAKQTTGIVIIDTTNLKPQNRQNLLKQLGFTNLHCVAFKITDQQMWLENLAKRNEAGEKKITKEVLEFLSKDAAAPSLAEGFLSIRECPARGEQNWREVFQESIDQLITLYLQNPLSAEESRIQPTIC